VGDIVRGRVDWYTDGRAPKGVSAQLEWGTQGRGTRNVGVQGRVRHDGESGPIPPSFDFQFPIPPEGPMSYDGRLLRVLWQVTARIEIPWGRDENAGVAFRVVPVAREPR
jgi:hypothetical protein